MKHEIAVQRPQRFDHPRGRFGDQDTLGHQAPLLGRASARREAARATLAVGVCVDEVDGTSSKTTGAAAKRPTLHPIQSDRIASRRSPEPSGCS